MKLLEKSALLQNKVLGLLWLFANVLMCVGKKDAGKKNKFLGEKGFKFLRFNFNSILKFRNLDFCNRTGSIAYNSKIYVINKSLI